MKQHVEISKPKKAQTTLGEYQTEGAHKQDWDLDGTLSINLIKLITSI